jgi:MFS family permease
MIVFGLVAHSLVVASLIAVDDVLLGFALVVLAGILGAPAYTGTTTIVADVVPPERQEAGYAAVRVANNLGLVLGPPVAALLLLGHNWTLFLAGVAVMGGVACAVAVRFLPAVGAHAKETLPSGALRLIARDTPFVLLLVSTLLGFMVYVPFEVVLPVVAVQSFGLAPSTWGFLMVINPLLVSLCQLRLTEAVRLVPPALKLAAGLMLMGFPFLLLVASGSVPVLALVLVLFVFGEMLWVPTSQALAARIAPEQLRGAYMGAFTGSSAIAWTLAPLIALNLRAAAGNAPMWIFFAALAIVGAFAGVAARRAADGASDLPAFAETT